MIEINKNSFEKCEVIIIFIIIIIWTCHCWRSSFPNWFLWMVRSILAIIIQTLYNYNTMKCKSINLTLKTFPKKNIYNNFQLNAVSHWLNKWMNHVHSWYTAQCALSFWFQYYWEFEIGKIISLIEMLTNILIYC